MALTKVSTDGVKDDAITSGKIPANAVGASELADNAVDTNAIANNAVTAGKTSGVATTINNNADNRVITGSGTANTLNAESGVVINSSGNLGINESNPLAKLHVGGDQFFTGSSSIEGGSSAGTLTVVGGSTFKGGRIVLGGGSGNDDIRFSTSGASTTNTERMRIDSSGRVLLGTTTEGFGTADDLTIASSTDTGITIRSGTSNQGNIFFSDGTSGTDEFRGIIQYTHGSGTGEHLRFFVQSAEKVRLDSDGLKLNGDTAAANALDDYEEGSFTPQVKFGGNSNNQSYNYQMGRYTKIGNRVFFHLYFALTNKGTASGSARVYGLPFSAAGVGVGYAHCSCWVNGSNFGNTTPTGYVPPSQNYFHIERQRTDGGGVHSCDHTNFNNNTDMMISGHYIV